MCLPTRPLCCFRHYWPWHLDHSSLILVWYPWLCSQLVQIISVNSSLRVKCVTDLSSWHTSSCGVPRALSLVHCSSSCIPLLSAPSFPLVPFTTTSRHFLSFFPTHFDSSIDHLHNALDQISSWMTANLLTLNSSKTEFLLIGLSKQLAKINNSSLTTTHSARSIEHL